jgi:hypothetical protein
MRQLTPLLVAVALAVAAHAGRAQQPSAANSKHPIVRRPERTSQFDRALAYGLSRRRAPVPHAAPSDRPRPI